MAWEFDVLDWLQTLHTPTGDAFMIFVSRLGNGGFLWIVFAAVLLLIPKYRKAGAVAAAALLADLILCNIILKPLVARVRPYNVNTLVELLVSKPGEYSFPSGHTAAAFSVTFALLFAHCKLWIPAGVLASVIAFSRMYLYVHYPTDILGGIMVGAVAGSIAVAVVRVICKKRS